jgi:hypothetical protein
MLPPGQRSPGPEAAVGILFSTIPTGYNTLVGFESQRLEFLTGFTKGVRVI